MAHDAAGDVKGFAALQVTKATSADAVVVRFAGELDLSTVAVFVEAVDDALDQQPKIIELDMADLSFIDSSGLGAYVTAFRRARAAGTDLRLGARSALVQRVFEISGVETALASESPDA